METIHIDSLPIKLGQFLKLIQYVNEGIEAKQIIASGKIKVNGENVYQRGKKLFADDTIEIESGLTYTIISTP